jgi:hypothetical protein
MAASSGPKTKAPGSAGGCLLAAVVIERGNLLVTQLQLEERYSSRHASFSINSIENNYAQFGRNCISGRVRGNS